MPFIKLDGTSGKDVQVRAILALMFTIGVTAGFFMGLINSESYMTLVTMAVSFYFAKSTVDDKNPPNNPVQ